jgi:hypothetical protein
MAAVEKRVGTSLCCVASALRVVELHCLVEHRSYWVSWFVRGECVLFHENMCVLVQ